MRALGFRASSEAVRDAARALGVEAQLGSIEVGEKADIAVVGGNVAAPFDAILAAHPRDVRLVMAGGTVLYGELVVEPLAPAAPGCEHLALCGRTKFVCVARAGATATDKLGPDPRPDHERAHQRAVELRRHESVGLGLRATRAAGELPGGVMQHNGTCCTDPVSSS